MRDVTDMDIVMAVQLREQVQEAVGEAMTKLRDFYPPNDEPGEPGTLGNTVWRMAERLTEAYEIASEVVGQMRLMAAAPEASGGSGEGT